MQNIGDVVIHQKTRRIGKVVGYGHQIVDAVYQPTLIVRTIKGIGLSRKKNCRGFGYGMATVTTQRTYSTCLNS